MTETRAELTAVVLAGGRGSRLLPHTAEIPKPLVEVGGKPIVEYLLAQLKRGGVRRVIVAVNHMADQIETCLGDGSRFGLRIEYSHETKPLSTVGPLKLIDDLPDNFIVANGDILSDLDIRALYDFHVSRQAELTVATYEGKENIDYGVMELDTEHRVVSFVEKPDYSFIVSMGLYVFNRSVLDYVPEGEPFGFDRLMLSMLKRRIDIHAYPYDGFWLDIGRPSDYERAQADIERVKKLL
jgi:NDP-sugar pyrophosphorylase family protein